MLLVADAALGQEAVSVAEHFNRALELTGFILSKLDGDARGGAALSIRKVTGCPVKFIGLGEKLDSLEVFHPDRMASRILGMGDVVFAGGEGGGGDRRGGSRKLRRSCAPTSSTMTTFSPSSARSASSAGWRASSSSCRGRQLTQAMNGVDPRHFARMEAVILSMTKAERANPDLIDSRAKSASRKGPAFRSKRSATGQAVRRMRKMMKHNGPLGRLLAGGNMPENNGVPGSFGGLLGGGPAPLSRKEQDKKNASPSWPRSSARSSGKSGKEFRCTVSSSQWRRGAGRFFHRPRSRSRFGASRAA
jgi:signal recognition particle subunit SRP54